MYLARNLQDIAESTDSVRYSQVYHIIPRLTSIYLAQTTISVPPVPCLPLPAKPITPHPYPSHLHCSRPFKHHLTVSQYLKYSQGCVATRHFKMALSILQIPITEIDHSLGDLHYNDNLLYHYAGGMVFAALKRWEEAEEFFEICVSSPAQVPAAIQLEAHKKLTLVQLISRGTVSLPGISATHPALTLSIKTAAVPKYTNNSLVRLLKTSPYGSFAKAYPQQIETLKKIAESDSALFSNVRPQLPVLNYC